MGSASLHGRVKTSDRILLTLKRGPLTYAQLAQRTAATNPGTFLQRLTADGLVTRIEGEYVLTAAGLAVAKGLADAQRA